MSSHYEWGDAKAAYCALYIDLEEAEEDLKPDVALDGPAVLVLTNLNGDGLVLEDTASNIIAYVDLLHSRVHRDLDHMARQEAV